MPQSTIQPTARAKTTIIAAAEKAFTPRNQVNCSAYVRDVALSIGEYMPDLDANQMIDYMKSNPSWHDLGNNDVAASKMAGQHYFVVAGLSNPNGHGHVVVIVPGRKNGYAKGFWGSLSHPSEARENEGIDYAFTKYELPEFQYFATPVSALVASP